MRKRVEKEPVPNAISAEGVGGEEAFKTPQCSTDTVSAAPVPTLGGQWPEDCGVAGPPSPSVPAVFSVGRTWSLTPFFKDNGIKNKKIIWLFRPLSFGREGCLPWLLLGRWDLSSPTWDQTHSPRCGSTDS